MERKKERKEGRIEDIAVGTDNTIYFLNDRIDRKKSSGRKKHEYLFHTTNDPQFYLPGS